MSSFDPVSSPHAGSSRHVTFSGKPTEGAEAPLLEGRLYVPTDGELHPGVVLCHANPAAGGNMDMGIVQSIEAALIQQGMASLRYNSRGVGNSGGSVSRSSGRHLVAPEGELEREDVGAALDFLAAQEGVNDQKLSLVGHSFGARILLAYLAAHPEEERVQAVVCIGLPVGWRNLEHLGKWPGPKLFVTGDRDDFCPPEELARYVATLPEPSTLVTLKGTGHFLEGRTEDLGKLVANFLTSILG
jgi:uncharacterized protein